MAERYSEACADQQLGARYAPAAIVLVLVIVTLVCNIPDTPLVPPIAVTRTLHDVFPQGWAFFTRDARESRRDVFRIDEPSRRLYEINLRNRTLVLGFDRSRARLRVELGSLLSQLTEHDWHDCAAAAGVCFARHEEPPVPITNKSRQPTFCGRYYVREYKPVPWAWATAAQTLRVPARSASIAVECH